jgi:hypothetical protein
MVYEIRNPKAPWLTASANDLLSSLIKKSDVAFEWGSGRSTLWLAERVSELTSLEHKKIWFNRVSQKIKQKGVTNVNLIFVETTGNENGDSIPYVRAIETFAPNSLDFCLIDGIYRDACAMRALKRIKPSGFLILDNSNWFLPCQSFAPSSRTELDGPATKTWALFMEAVRDWHCIWTSNGVSDTAIWFKPCLL